MPQREQIHRRLDPQHRVRREQRGRLHQAVGAGAVREAHVVADGEAVHTGPDRRLGDRVEPARMRAQIPLAQDHADVDHHDLKRAAPRISRAAPGRESPPIPGGTPATARIVPLTIAATVAMARSVRSSSSTRTRTGTPRGVLFLSACPTCVQTGRAARMRRARAVSAAGWAAWHQRAPGAIREPEGTCNGGSSRSPSIDQTELKSDRTARPAIAQVIDM